jgi:prolyl-tRNA synthetase
VLPPRVAPIQAIIIPIAHKSVSWDDLKAYSNEVAQELRAHGVRVDTDYRQNYTAGWKYNHWEQKGVPLRIEVGPRDITNRQVRIARRDNGEKQDLSLDGLGAAIAALMDTIHNDMFQRSKADRDSKIVVVREWKDFVPALNRHCLCLTPWCDDAEWEDRVKARSREEAADGVEDARSSTSVAAKTLCKPFDAPPLEAGTMCFVSGLPAKTWVLWGRSY